MIYTKFLNKNSQVSELLQILSTHRCNWRRSRASIFTPSSITMLNIFTASSLHCFSSNSHTRNSSQHIQSAFVTTDWNSQLNQLQSFRIDSAFLVNPKLRFILLCKITLLQKREPSDGSG